MTVIYFFARDESAASQFAIIRARQEGIMDYYVAKIEKSGLKDTYTSQYPQSAQIERSNELALSFFGPNLATYTKYRTAILAFDEELKDRFYLDFDLYLLKEM